MKLSPNDPCHCASGKKYKKCCMLKDEAAARAAAQAKATAAAAPPPPPPASPKPINPLEPPSPVKRREPSPEDARWEAMMDELDRAALPRQLELISQLIADDFMDGETAFDALNAVFERAVKQHALGSFDEAVALIQQGAPEVFEEKRALIAEWQLEAALLQGRSDELEPLAMILARHAGKEIDGCNRLLSILQCHGKTSLCARMAEEAWPHVRDSKDIMGWAIEDFQWRGMRLVVLDRWETDRDNLAVDDDLRARLTRFGDCDWNYWQAALDLLCGRADRKWSMKDFDFPAVPQPADPPKPQKGARREQRERNLALLGFEFIRWAKHDQGIATTLANIGVLEAQDYVIQRADAALGPRLSLEDRLLHPASTKALRSYPKPDHVLCPDSQTVDTFLGKYANMFGPRLPEAAAFAAMVPVWLAFLASRGLIDDNMRDRGARAVAELHGDLQKLLPEHLAALAGLAQSSEQV